MKRTRISLLIAAALTVGCSAQRPRTATPAAKNPEIEAQLARELEPQPVHAVAAPDGSVKAKMEASAAPQLSQDQGLVQLVAPLDQHAMVCFVYQEMRDVAALARVIADATLVKNAPKHQWVDVHGDQVEGWGYLVARAQYLVDTDKGKMIGEFKIATSVRGETSVACVLDAPGLYATFERSLRSLLGSLDSAANRKLEKPSEEQLMRTNMPGRMVSISRVARFKQPGGYVSEQFSGRLMIGPEGELQAGDSASIETYERGVLNHGNYVSISGGQSNYELELSYNGKAYHVEGKFQDKPITSNFTVQGGLTDHERQDAEVCKVRDGKQPKVEIPEYSPDTDPMKPLTTVIQKSQVQDADVIASLGSEPNAPQISAQLARDCEFTRGTVTIGPVKMELERLWDRKAKR